LLNKLFKRSSDLDYFFMIWVVLKFFLSTMHLADRLTENSLLMNIVINLGKLWLILFLLLRLVYFYICVHNISVSIDIDG